ncbi:MAG: TIGR03790 family protein [Acidobacteriia bacterium]|nr:TIGR03790 family protein [Terriglobia bacterium]
MKALISTLLLAAPLFAQGPENVLVVVNDNSPVSREIAEYYARRRAVPMRNLCRIKTTAEENIPRAAYNAEIAAPIAGYLRKNNLAESILYIVTTAGVPLRIPGGGSAMNTESASVDSELALLYLDMHTGRPHALPGSLPNPFFGKRGAKFTHPQFPIYLVTRLQAYDFNDVKAMIDRSLSAANRGKFAIDLRSSGDDPGDNWLRSAAMLIPKDRVILDESTKVLYNQKDVIGYAAWGSNDKNRRERFLHFQWLPGAVATEFVSTNARTFARPPEKWNLSDWNSPQLWFAGSPQTMTADLIQEGVTAATGHVAEPYLALNPHPEFLLPEYYKGRNLAESYYMSLRGLSWQNIVLGDPLCSLGKP